MHSMSEGNADRETGVIDVGAGLLVERGCVLISRRLKGAHLGGLWEFPGGKREPDETWEACVARELREELGIEARVGGLYWEVVHRYPEKAVRLRFYRVARAGGEPTALHCAAIAWASRETLLGYEFPAADRELIARLRTDEGFWDSRETL